MSNGETSKLPAKADSAAEKQRARMDALISAVESRSTMLRTLLSETGITFERFVEVFRRALIQNDELLACDAGSVVQACINACTDGLLPDGKEAAIVVYRVNSAPRGAPASYTKRANFQPMYMGLLKIAYASGNFQSIECRVVYEGDQFEYDLGDQPFIKHRPKTRPAGTAQPPIVAAYAVAKTINGGVFREVFEGADIAKVNAVSRATNGPGKSWGEEMARKGPLRRLFKFLPKTPAMERIVERDNEGFDLEGLDVSTTPVREKVLRPGFAPPPQIEQGADMTVNLEMGDAEAVDAGVLDPAGRADAAEGLSSHAPGDDARRAPAGESDGLPEGGASDATAKNPTQAPEVVTFKKMLAAATSWLNVKQALKTFAKTETGQKEAYDRVAKVQAWGRVHELREEGKDKTDFISDPLLFECWLLGDDSADDRDSVAGNWAIVNTDKAFAKLPDEDQARITQRVALALEE